ncbi:unnamed protein product [Pedinophyceae sp. YPF-701]|nr:unnamed protein product [Pedinophyceae sp. YPF-701]
MLPPPARCNVRRETHRIRAQGALGPPFSPARPPHGPDVCFAPRAPRFGPPHRLHLGRPRSHRLIVDARPRCSADSNPASLALCSDPHAMANIEDIVQGVRRKLMLAETDSERERLGLAVAALDTAPPEQGGGDAARDHAAKAGLALQLRKQLDAAGTDRARAQLGLAVGNLVAGTTGFGPKSADVLDRVKSAGLVQAVVRQLEKAGTDEARALLGAALRKLLEGVGEVQARWEAAWGCGAVATLRMQLDASAADGAAEALGAAIEALLGPVAGESGRAQDEAVRAGMALALRGRLEAATTDGARQMLGAAVGALLADVGPGANARREEAARVGMVTTLVRQLAQCGSEAAREGVASGLAGILEGFGTGLPRRIERACRAGANAAVRAAMGLSEGAGATQQLARCMAALLTPGGRDGTARRVAFAQEGAADALAEGLRCASTNGARRELARASMQLFYFPEGDVPADVLGAEEALAASLYVRSCEACGLMTLQLSRTSSDGAREALCDAITEALATDDPEVDGRGEAAWSAGAADALCKQLDAARSEPARLAVLRTLGALVRPGPHAGDRCDEAAAAGIFVAIRDAVEAAETDEGVETAAEVTAVLLVGPRGGHGGRRGGDAKARRADAARAGVGTALLAQVKQVRDAHSREVVDLAVGMVMGLRT